jgi:hypothetical protein
MGTAPLDFEIRGVPNERFASALGRLRRPQLCDKSRASLLAPSVNALFPEAVSYDRVGQKRLPLGRRQTCNYPADMAGDHAMRKSAAAVRLCSGFDAIGPGEIEANSSLRVCSRPTNFSLWDAGNDSLREHRISHLKRLCSEPFWDTLVQKRFDIRLRKRKALL